MKALIPSHVRIFATCSAVQEELKVEPVSRRRYLLNWSKVNLEMSWLNVYKWLKGLEFGHSGAYSPLPPHAWQVIPSCVWLSFPAIVYPALWLERTRELSPLPPRPPRPPRPPLPPFSCINWACGSREVRLLEVVSVQRRSKVLAFAKGVGYLSTPVSICPTS